MLNYVDDTCTTLKVKFQPSIWVWLRQSLIYIWRVWQCMDMAKPSVIFFFLASIGSARWLRPNTARSQHARKTAVSLINFTTMHGKLETANVRPQNRLIKYLISNLFDPIFSSSGPKDPMTLCHGVASVVRPSFPSVHSFQNASSSSFLNRFWFWLFHKIGLGGGFKTSTQNCEIHYLW